MWSLQETTAAAKSWNRKSVAYRAHSQLETHDTESASTTVHETNTQKTAASFPVLVTLESSLAVNMAPSCWTSIELTVTKQQSTKAGKKKMCWHVMACCQS